jgi:L-ribulose-5-phosphate 4-epimerase
MDWHALMINPEHRDMQKALLDRHCLRKHGANAYYGQK